MATIDDLPIRNFQDMSDEELQQLILQTRSRRRNPDPEVKKASVKKATSKAKKEKAIALIGVSEMLKGLSSEQATELLKKLKG